MTKTKTQAKIIPHQDKKGQEKDTTAAVDWMVVSQEKELRPSHTFPEVAFGHCYCGRDSSSRLSSRPNLCPQSSLCEGRRRSVQVVFPKVLVDPYSIPFPFTLLLPWPCARRCCGTLLDMFCSLRHLFFLTVLRKSCSMHSDGMREADKGAAQMAVSCRAKPLYRLQYSDGVCQKRIWMVKRSLAAQAGKGFVAK